MWRVVWRWLALATFTTFTPYPLHHTPLPSPPCFLCGVVRACAHARGGACLQHFPLTQTCMPQFPLASRHDTVSRFRTNSLWVQTPSPSDGTFWRLACGGPANLFPDVGRLPTDVRVMRFRWWRSGGTPVQFPLCAAMFVHSSRYVVVLVRRANDVMRATPRRATGMARRRGRRADARYGCVRLIQCGYLSMGDVQRQRELLFYQ